MGKVYYIGLDIHKKTISFKITLKGGTFLVMLSRMPRLIRFVTAGL